MDDNEVCPLTETELHEAAMAITDGIPVELLTSAEVQRMMTIGQYVFDLGLADLERRGEIEFHEGEPMVPYLSDHMVETILTRPLPVN